jgi:Undecaprenyl-phosphate glucose phosphotransferase
MVKFKTRLLATVYVLVDVSVTCLAWIGAYFLRFHSEWVLAYLPVTKGVPEISRYVLLLPVIAVLWPLLLYFHGLYKLKRGRSRIDELFAILFSVLIGSAGVLGLTLYARVYYFYQPDVAPQWEYSQAVFGLFVVLDIVALNLGRWAIRAQLQRSWKAGHNVERVLVAGGGDLGQMVAETLTAHRELGYEVVGFVDDIKQKQLVGLPVLGGLGDTVSVATTQRVDQVYIALPLEQHAELLKLIKCVSNECLDVKVVPDLVQYATSKAALEDLDGIPIISLNEVPLSGWNSMAKRVLDIALGSAILFILTFVIPLFPILTLLVKLKGGKGPIFFRQERMSLDGKTFQMYKFRSMSDDAEAHTGPVWAKEEDPRRTRIGAWLRRFNLDELPQLFNVVLGDMSLVGPRPERPPFVQQFKERIPQYMLRHRVRSGITGWAQVNGWRGNTSIEKRLECDLYYIENWSLLLDIKILILTIFRGFGQPHAY